MFVRVASFENADLQRLRELGSARSELRVAGLDCQVIASGAWTGAVPAASKEQEACGDATQDGTNSHVSGAAFSWLCRGPFGTLWVKLTTRSVPPHPSLREYKTQV